jgi:two-component system cell cycle sensor histidine kinase/response regulator CckA
MKRLPEVSRNNLYPNACWSLWQAYAFAVAAPVATLFIRFGLGVAFGERPLLILFMFPIILASYLGGLGPGLVSTILSAAIVDYFLIPTVHSLRIEHAHDAAQLFMLILNGVLVSFLNAALLRSRMDSENRSEAFNRANMQLEEEINERKRAEEALRSEKALLRCLIDTPSDLIFIKDREGAYLGCNMASEEFIGMPECEQIGKTDFDFFDRERAEAIREIERRVIAEGKPLRIEEWVTNRDGVKVPLDTLKAPYCAPDGKALGLVGICRDITERKMAEVKLKLAGLYNRSLIEASLDPLVTIGHDGRITDVNAATERVTGYPREELIGADFSAYFTDHEKADAGYQRVFRNGMVHDYELELRHKDGHVTPVLYNASIYRDERGNIAGVFAAARDISLRKELEKQLRQSQKMEAIGTLAGGVAHEFNNIMTAVIGYGSLLKMKLANDALLLPKVNSLLHAADRAAVLVRSLLSFSRKQGSDLKPIDLNELVSRVGELMESLIREDIQLNVSLAKGLHSVMADNSQLEQILVNLLNNAQDAMPDGGQISLSTASVELDSNFLETHGFGEPGTYAVITFSDNGEGMGEETRQKIFEPFFTTREVGKGTGLGLSICYGIIKQHNGYIICDSEPGKGTTFFIYLPINSTGAEKCGPGANAPIAGGTETILIAEDNEDVRAVAREILEEHGYKVIEAVDGRDALSKFNDYRDKISLIIIDVIMPRMNGRELYKEISRLKPGMKVVFSSGYTDAVLPEGVKGLNGFPFLPKPFVPDKLLWSVRNVLDGRL